jgi:hypothetical protein
VLQPNLAFRRDGWAVKGGEDGTKEAEVEFFVVPKTGAFGLELFLLTCAHPPSYESYPRRSATLTFLSSPMTVYSAN